MPGKILLIVPPVTRPKDYAADRIRVSPFFPLGLAYLSSSLQAQGYEVAILDCLKEGWKHGPRDCDNGVRYGLQDEEIVTHINRHKPHWIGISCLFSAQEWDAKNVAELAKVSHKQRPVIVGGPHAGSNCKAMLESCPAIDYVIIGEGERSLPSLLHVLHYGGLECIDGLALRAGSEIRIQPKHHYVNNLDALRHPDRSTMEWYLEHGYAHDRYKKRPFTQVITSRGCPFKCTFCQLAQHHGAKQRFRPVSDVIAEIDDLIWNHGIQEIHFEDDNLTADRPRARDLFTQMAKRYNLSWACPTGMACSCLDEELLGLMAKSGCYSVTLAIESGVQRVVTDLMRKPVNLAKVPALVKAIKANGMIARGFFMLGYPGETKAEIEQTVAYAKSLELDWTFFFIATPLPGTVMWKMAEDMGWLRQGAFNPLTSLHDTVLESPEWDKDWLAQIRDRANEEANFTGNPNIKRNPKQAKEDFEYVLSMYPNLEIAKRALEGVK